MVLKSLIGTTCACLIVASFNVSAALIGRDLDGNASTAEAYYDESSNLTWLADANYAKSSGFDNDGLMLYRDAAAWIADLSIGGVTGWRLPVTLNTDYSCDDQRTFNYQVLSSGFNCTSGEMGNLFYNTLGNTAGSMTESGPFTNIQDSYWTGTGEGSLSQLYNWIFIMENGIKSTARSGGWEPQLNNMYVWAVHDGDVGATVVPIPAALWLFVSGLIGLVSMSRRRVHHSMLL